MLRCSHATALRTQFIPSAALRAPLSSPWAKAPRSCSLLAQAHKPAQAVTFPTVLPQLRLYSTRFDDDDDSHWDSRSPEALDESEEPRWSSNSIGRPRKRPVKAQHRIHGPWAFRKNKQGDHLVRIAMGKGSPVSRNEIQMELKWIRDRVVLAQRVRRLLNKDDITFAYALVHAAHTQGMDSAAAWNDILAYCMDKGSPLGAWRFWNKMKKLGNQPNAFSYTIMLRGISQNERYPGYSPIDMALKVYRGLHAPNSTIEPNIIIGNAMLGVCSRHNDMDTLWEIAGELPEEGPGSPDDRTYTIILNAIRTSIQKSVAELQESPRTTKNMMRYRRLLGVVEGKKIWGDVVYLWKRGQIQMTDQLVSAMAGILLEGPEERHLYDVFDLYRQTTGIPNYSRSPKETLSSRLRAYRNTLVYQTTEDIPFVDVADVEDGLPNPGDVQPADLAKVEEEERDGFEGLFDPVLSKLGEPVLVGSDRRPAVSDTGAMWMPVSNRTLTRLLDVALLTNDYGGIAKRYWEHFMHDAVGYRLKPDLYSCLAYLRILRLTRSAKASVALFHDTIIPAGSADGVLFHLAMSVCRRDRKNFNILLLANELMALMNEHLVLPDARAVSGYLDLINILTSNSQLLIALKGLDDKKQELAHNNLEGDLHAVYRELRLDLQLIAIETARPAVAKLKTAMEEFMKGPPTKAQSANRVTMKVEPQGGHEIILLMQNMRRMLDSFLQNATEKHHSKEFLKSIKEESLGLRIYSNAQLSDQYTNKHIYPTMEQKVEFVARTKKETEATKEGDAERLSSEQLPPFKLPETQLPEAQSGELPSQEPNFQTPQSQDSQPRETQLQETQAEESQSGEPQLRETQVDGVNSQEFQPEEVQSQETQSQDSLPEEVKAEESQSQEQPQESPSETPLPQEAQAVEPKSQESQFQEAQAEKAPSEKPQSDK
ncbi:hypothetical protein BJY01DRAFT_226507 [Aspergillus pseudoustus]|uniref:Pentatricopeptide repeat protein n=1 Tax=Aspergillus pseudoustus TaxID=1810923 RepID=A0ABR4IWH4_9EURO